MTRVPLLLAGVTKEIRALLPTWLALTAAMGVVALIGDRRSYALGVLVYFLGSVALGAQSIGHEYTHHTLTLFLSQPARRGRLFLVKLTVLTTMLFTLAAVAWGVLFHPRDVLVARVWADSSRGLTPLTLALLCGLIVAPWLTMLCRSPLAGVVFTIVIPAWLWTLSQVLAAVKFGTTRTPEIVRFESAVFWTGMLGFCAIAAVLNWRMFSRLESDEAKDRDVQLPQWLRGRATTIAAAPVARARSQSSFRVLVKKELRLQQMTCVFTGLYLLICATLLFLRDVVPGFVGLPISAVTVLYTGCLAPMIGSLASAEERQFGTLEWQVLLPMATWKQWAVKAGTALSAAIVLLLGLPWLMSQMLPPGDHIPLSAWTAGTVVVLTTGSLYVSSVCGSGLRAFLLSLLVMVVVGPLVARFGSAVWWALRTGWPAFIMATAFVALALRFGLVNHRSAERGAGRVWWQVSWMIGSMTLGVLLLSVVWTLD